MTHRISPEARSKARARGRQLNSALPPRVFRLLSAVGLVGRGCLRRTAQPLGAPSGLGQIRNAVTNLPRPDFPTGKCSLSDHACTACMVLPHGSAMPTRRRPQGNMTHQISPEARSACPERGVSRVERGARARGRQLDSALPKQRSRPGAAARVRQNRASEMHWHYRRQPNHR